MAIFKPLRGNREALDAQPLHDGYAYFCTNDGTFHIDYTDADGNLQRKQLNAKNAETLIGLTLDEIKTQFETQIKETYIDSLDSKFVKTDAGEDGEQTIKGYIRMIGDDGGIYVSADNEYNHASIVPWSISAGYYNDESGVNYSSIMYADCFDLYEDSPSDSKCVSYCANGIITNNGIFNFPVTQGDNLYTFTTSFDYITWAELKSRRDNGQLVPGQFYRITDYQCTTTQQDTQSAGHQFDIIVQALSENTLSENAKADYHKEDTYFCSMISKKISSSNIISEQVETPIEEDQVEWLYKMYEDGAKFSYTGEEEGPFNDEFVAFSFLQNNDGIIVPVLYKTAILNDDGEPLYSREDVDYEEPYYYVGEQYIDGVAYDKWRRIEELVNPTEDNKLTWYFEGKEYALTNKIVGEGLLIEATFEYRTSIEKKANLSAWELKYCLDNDTSRFAWANNKKAFKVYSNDDGETFIYVRCPECDSSDGLAWAYVHESGGDDFLDIEDWSEVDPSDLIYTDTETVLDGDILDMNGVKVTVVGKMHTGKGVIYYMRDELGNECPYDFKNIMFTRPVSVDQDYYSIYYNEDSNYKPWLYTFTAYDIESCQILDASILEVVNGDLFRGCANNIIKECSTIERVQSLNNNVFINNFNKSAGIILLCDNNIFGNNCANNTFGNNCRKNVFESECSKNIFGDNCIENAFGYYCGGNIFGNHCSNNTFRDSCINNIFESECYRNIFGDNCMENAFAFDCGYNIFETCCNNNSFATCCYNNIFGMECINNIFGNDCNRNIFGNACLANTFGSQCRDNTFANSCYSNTFGDDCSSNTFGINCHHNVFKYDCAGIEPLDYVHYVTFADSCSYIELMTDEPGGDDYWLQYITITSGVKGSESKPRQIYITRTEFNEIRPEIYEPANTTHILLN